MPTFNSATYDAQISDNPRNRLDATNVNAEVRFAEIEYKVKATEAAGDILKLWQIPAGVVLYAEEAKVISEGIGGTGVTLTKIGDQADDDRYSATAAALTAAGIVAVTPVLATGVAPRVPIDSTNNVLQATLGGTLPATVNKRFWLKMPYRLV
jgi:hypothetical protein